MFALSLREQILISIMCFLVLGLGGAVGYQKIEQERTALQQRLQNHKAQLKQVESLVQQWQEVQRVPTAPVMTQPLSSFIEGISRSLEIQDHLQLNVLNSVPEGTKGVQIRFDQLTLDQTIDVLYRLENHRPVLQIRQLNFSISPGNRFARLSFQVYKQTN